MFDYYECQYVKVVVHVVQFSHFTCLRHVSRLRRVWSETDHNQQQYTRVPKQLLYAELSSGKRKTGGQWKRYKDQLKANLKKCEMDLQWETTADDRAYWRRTSRMGLQTLSGDGSSRRQRRESGERTENMITTLQTVQYACAMCVVEYVDQQSASTATYALIEHKYFHPHYHHHFG